MPNKKPRWIIHRNALCGIGDKYHVEEFDHMPKESEITEFFESYPDLTNATLIQTSNRTFHFTRSEYTDD